MPDWPQIAQKSGLFKPNRNVGKTQLIKCQICSICCLPAIWPNLGANNRPARPSVSANMVYFHRMFCLSPMTSLVNSRHLDICLRFVGIFLTSRSFSHNKRYNSEHRGWGRCNTPIYYLQDWPPEKFPFECQTICQKLDIFFKEIAKNSLFFFQVFFLTVKLLANFLTFK